MKGKNFNAFLFCENCTKKLCYENVKEVFRFLSHLGVTNKVKNFTFFGEIYVK
jgi:hypothetical protein